MERRNGIELRKFKQRLQNPAYTRDGHGLGRPAGLVGSGRGSDSRQIWRVGSVGSKFLKCIQLNSSLLKHGSRMAKGDTVHKNKYNDQSQWGKP